MVKGAEARSDSSDLKDLLIERALRDIPKILMLQDRNPHSATYGCFDRNYWHYKIIDFPSGMAQEFVLPLALAYRLDVPGNALAGQPSLREWVKAGIRYAASSAHADGSCDDYFPFEKAAGAAAFSLYASLRAIEVCELDAHEFLPFLIKRGNWLAEHKEGGELSNHEALIANSLFRLAALTGDERFLALAKARLERLMSWRSDEGWFSEYQGADPGYLTLSIALLAEIDAMHPELGLRPAISGAVAFLAAIQPPDGWLGGEWTSRNTHNYFPHGFELCGAWLPEALVVNTRAIRALALGGPEYADDHIVAHHCWSYLLAARAWQDDRPALPKPPAGRRVFPEAGIVIEHRENLALLLALNKGGTFRLYDAGKLIFADTGISLTVDVGGRRRVAVCHLWADDNTVAIEGDHIEIAGRMGWAKTQRMTPFKLIVLRVLMLSVGRIRPDLVRRMLQTLLITGRSPAPFDFRRRFLWSNGALTVEDAITGSGWSKVTSAGRGPSQTSIYTVMSRIWHPSQLQPWEDLTHLIPREPDTALTVRRSFGGGAS